MLDVVVSTAFQYVRETDEVGLDVGVRVNERISHPCLRRKMHHALKTFGGEKRLHAGGIGHIHLDEAKIWEAAELRQPGMLEVNVVVVVEVIDTDHFIPSRQQAEGSVHADESGSAGEQDFHPADFTPSVSRLGTHHARWGEHDTESAAFAEFAFNFKARLMAGENVLNDGKAKASAASSS